MMYRSHILLWATYWHYAAHQHVFNIDISVYSCPVVVCEISMYRWCVSSSFCILWMYSTSDLVYSLSTNVAISGNISSNTWMQSVQSHVRSALMTDRNIEIYYTYITQSLPVRCDITDANFDQYTSVWSLSGANHLVFRSHHHFAQDTLWRTGRTFWSFEFSLFWAGKILWSNFWEMASSAGRALTTDHPTCTVVVQSFRLIIHCPDIFPWTESVVTWLYWQNYLDLSGYVCAIAHSIISPERKQWVLKLKSGRSEICPVSLFCIGCLVDKLVQCDRTE